MRARRNEVWLEEPASAAVLVLTCLKVQMDGSAILKPRTVGDFECDALKCLLAELTR
jgi:hypothetical protein